MTTNKTKAMVMTMTPVTMVTSALFLSLVAACGQEDALEANDASTAQAMTMTATDLVGTEHQTVTTLGIEYTWSGSACDDESGNRDACNSGAFCGDGNPGRFSSSNPIVREDKTCFCTCSARSGGPSQ